MATYAIGDIQGCFDSLQDLLSLINFNPQQDSLWLCGDLINRGPKSLATLQIIFKYRKNIHCVLGNHDLHFLAVESGCRNASTKDTLSELLSAPDRAELIAWLSSQPLFHYDPKVNFAMAHAGIPACWDLPQALAFSKEVSNCLQSPNRGAFFEQMYGNEPSLWSPRLTANNRLRFITNALTRMRFCHADGALELNFKGSPGKQPDHLLPWFELPRQPLGCELVFGHWAALDGKCHLPGMYAIDTGCVWGGSLTALRLEDKQLFSVASREKSRGAS